MSRQESALFESACEVLEGNCFVFPVEEPTELGPAPTRRGAKVEFTGAFNGQLRIALIGLPVAQLCEALLEPDSPEEDAIDNFHEIANVLCGRALTSVFGHELIFDLGPPSQWEETEASDYEAVCATVHLDGGMLQVQLAFDKGGAEALRAAS